MKPRVTPSIPSVVIMEEIYNQKLDSTLSQEQVLLLSIAKRKHLSSVEAVIFNLKPCDDEGFSGSVCRRGGVVQIRSTTVGCLFDLCIASMYTTGYYAIQRLDCPLPWSWEALWAGSSRLFR